MHSHFSQIGNPQSVHGLSCLHPSSWRSVFLSVTQHNFGFPQLALRLCGASTRDILQSTIMISKTIINASTSLEKCMICHVSRGTPRNKNLRSKHKTVHELVKVFHTTASSCVKFYSAKATNSHVASATAWFTFLSTTPHCTLTELW